MARKDLEENDEELLEEARDDEDISEDEIEDLVTGDRASKLGFFAAGLIMGAVVGACAVWLTAPARGEITRRRMKRRLRDIRDDARDHIDDWRDDARRGLVRQRRRTRRRLRRKSE